MRIAICDDDRIILEEIDSMVRRYMENKKQKCTIQHFPSGEALLAASEADPPNIILLDVEMGKMNGIETAKLLREKGLNRTVIIFITALESHMQDAFDVRAFHYLIKPVRAERLADVLERAMQEERFLSGRDDPCMVVSLGGVSQKVYFKDILYIDCYNKKAEIHTSNGKISFYSSMKTIEDQLDNTFFRCHRSIIIGLRQVAGYDANNVRLVDGTTLPIARPQYHDFVKAYIRFLQNGGESIV